MGQKVNPHGLRVGVIKDWDSKWYAEKDFADYLVEDHKIRKFLKNKLYSAGVSKIEIERASDRVKIIVYTAKPGVVIGKGGSEIEKVKAELQKMTDKKVIVDIKEVKRPDKDAQLVAENIAQQLENRISFRRAMKSCMSRTMKSGVGNCLPLSAIPVGTQVHNIELHPGKGGQMVRSAGNSAQLMAKEGKYATLRLPSGEMRMVPIECRASVGVVGNGDHNLVNIGKAGRKRHMGIRPTVRGSVMNPNDHPHGGGEGKTGIGRPGPCTPWGKPALGLKTRKKNKQSNKLIIRRKDGRGIK